MPLGVWHSLASGCDKVTPQQAYEAVRLRTVPGDTKQRRDGWPDKNRLYDYVWLVYSIFFFIEPIARHNLLYWLEFAAVYGLFLVLYSGLVYARTKVQSYLLLIAMTILGLFYLPYNNSACGMLVYVAAFIPFISDSLGVVTGTIASLCVAVAIEGYLAAHQSLGMGISCIFLRCCRRHKSPYVAENSLESQATTGTGGD